MSQIVVVPVIYEIMYRYTILIKDIEEINLCSTF